MILNNIDSTNSVNIQAFGSLNAIKPSVRRFLNKSVFINDKDAYDTFKKTLANVRIEQKGNPFYDIEIAKYINLFTGEKHPSVDIFDKTNGGIIGSFNINNYIKYFPNAKDKYIITTALEDANIRATEQAFEEIDRALLKAEKEKNKPAQQN